MAIIDKPNDFFNTEIYTGNAGTRTIDNGFRSDFLWIKARSATTDYRLFDTLRGTEALVSNTDSGQINRAGYGFTSLANNGFTLNGNASGGEVNANNQPYVGRGSSAIPKNRWTLVTSTRDITTHKWYINQNNTQTTSNPFGVLATTTADCLIGYGYTGTYWAGKMSKMMTWDKALTPDEINTIFYIHSPLNELKFIKRN